MFIFTFLFNNVYVYYPTYWSVWVDPLNYEFKLNDLKQFSAYFTENTPSMNYKPNPVSAVQGNSRCLCKEP